MSVLVLTPMHISAAQLRSYNIVGAHFRPPAIAILKSISVNTKLFLRQEPDHPVTRKNAIGVWINSDELKLRSSAERLTSHGLSCGHSLDEILSIAEHQLGYIPAVFAEKMDIGEDDVSCVFKIAPNGQYKVEL